MPNLLLRNRKWLSSTETKAFMKFLNSKLVILVSSFLQWLGCFSPAFLIESNTFLSRSLGIFSKLSLFWVYNFLNKESCSVKSSKNPAKVDYGTPYFSSLGYLLRCIFDIYRRTAELNG